MNLQNLPSHDERSDRLKRCILPKNDALLAADYEAMEFRIAAWLLAAQPTLQDFTFANEILSGGDPHIKTAQMIHGRTEVTKQERDQAKRCMFSLLYSGTGKTIFEQGLTDTLSEAYDFVEEFHLARPQIRRLEDCVIRIAESRQLKEGVPYIRTIWGRPLWGDSRFALTRNVRGRKVLNHPLVNYLIQGTGADLMKDAILNIADFLDRGLYTSHNVLTIHDEIMLDCLWDEIPSIMGALPGLMGNETIEAVLPLGIDIEIATPTWADQGPTTDHFKEAA